MSTHETLGLMLVREGVINRTQLYDGLRLQRQNGRLLGTCLLSLGYISAEQLLEILAAQLGVPVLPPGSLKWAAPEAVERVPRDLALRLRILPYSFDGQMLGVAVADGRVLEHLHDVAEVARAAVGAYIALEMEIEATLGKLYGHAQVAGQLAEAPEPLPGRPRPMRVEPVSEVPTRDFGAALGLEAGGAPAAAPPPGPAAAGAPVVLERRKPDAPAPAVARPVPPPAAPPPPAPKPAPMPAPFAGPPGAPPRPGMVAGPPPAAAPRPAGPPPPAGRPPPAAAGPAAAPVPPPRAAAPPPAAAQPAALATAPWGVPPGVAGTPLPRTGPGAPAAAAGGPPPPRAPGPGQTPPSGPAPARASLERLNLYSAVEAIYGATNVEEVGRLVGRAMLEYFERVGVFVLRHRQLAWLDGGAVSPSRAEAGLETIPEVVGGLGRRKIAYGPSSADPRAAELSQIFGFAPAATSFIAPIDSESQVRLLLYADNGARTEVYDDLHDVELLFKEAETALGLLLHRT